MQPNHQLNPIITVYVTEASQLSKTEISHHLQGVQFPHFVSSHSLVSYLSGNVSGVLNHEKLNEILWKPWIEYNPGSNVGIPSMQDNNSLYGKLSRWVA